MEISKQKPLISIIIPSYNQGKYIENTILSVLYQKYSNWELIIQDGNSKDNTQEVCLKYVKKDTRIKFYSETDQGFADAVNKALAKCTGILVGIQSSDDFYADQFVFSSVINIYQKYPYLHIISGRSIMVDTQLRKIISQEPHREVGFIKPETVFTLENHFSQGSTFFSLERANFIGGLDPSVDIVADTDFWVKIASYTPICLNRIYRTSQIWGCVTIQANQRSTDLSKFYLGRAKMAILHYQNKNIDLPINMKYNNTNNLILAALNHFNSFDFDQKEIIELYETFTKQKLSLKRRIKIQLCKIKLFREYFYGNQLLNSTLNITELNYPSYDVKWF